MVGRRDWLKGLASGAAGLLAGVARGQDDGESSHSGSASRDLTIVDLKITPIALPDPPILAASGCHGPYFLRNIVEVRTADGLVGVGETVGGVERTVALRELREHLVGTSAFAYRQWRDRPDADLRVYAGIELACLDAIGKALDVSLSNLLGGAVRNEVEFGAYLFYRYAADDPRVLDDERIVDDRGQGDRALDQWGEVRTPDAMAEMAWQFHQNWGFTHQKLKAGVLSPEQELETLRAINARFNGQAPLRIDPNGRWTKETAIQIGRAMVDLPMEYYEDPVVGQAAMGEVRQETGLPMSTNACVTTFDHIPEAVETRPIDVVLCDHHYWGGIPACQSLGTLASSLGWSLSQHSNNHAGITMAAMVHVGALIPVLTHPSDTHYPWLIEGADIIEGPNLKFSGGKLTIPERPGIGVALDRDKLARAHETYKKCGMRSRDDAALMQRIEPAWERLLF
ncbi:MAG: hypothetical protein KDA75_06100 [Planctomycetaceae bacterium]|nr:hypothetical protein [Planctomycetaceae bacterium]